MTRPDLDAIRARCDAATAGPWRVSTHTYPNGTTVVDAITGVSEPKWSDYGEGEGEWFTDTLTLVETDSGVYGPTMPDAQFIASARTDIPALLAYIDELETRTSYTVGETELAQRIATLEQELRDARAAFESCNRARRHCEDECASLRARACITNDAGEASLINTLEHMLAEERENVDTLRARVAELESEVAILRPWSVMLKRAHGALTDAGCVVPLEFDQSIEHAIKDLANRATRAEQLFVDEYDARRDVERQRDELQARIAVLEAMR